ncbi:ribosome silencing factor [bacterium]|nr:ribosome silencing factor [bacterium]
MGCSLVLRKKDTVTTSKKKTSLQKAKLLAYAAKNKKAIAPVVLDMQEHSGIADYFVIASGRSDIQVRAMVQEIERVCVEEKIKIEHTEGLGLWVWVLIDLGDVIVHMFTDKERQYYGLERLWKECKRVNLPKL